MILGAVVIGMSAVVVWVKIAPGPVSGVFAGASFALMGTIWLRAYARSDMACALMSSAAALVIAGFSHFSAASLLSEEFRFPSVVALTAAAALCFLAVRRSPSDSSCEEGREHTDPLKTRFVSALKMLWLPISGAMLSSFIFGLTWDPVASGEAWQASLPLYEECTFLAPCIGSLVVAAMASRSPSSAILAMQGVLLPCAVATILVLPALGIDVVWMQSLFQILQAAGFSVIVLVTWISLAAAVRAVRLEAVVSCSFAAFAVATMAGMGLIHMIGLAGKDLCLLLLTVYMALIAIWYALEAKREKNARVIDDLRPGAYISRRCDELEEGFGISQREKEVLYFLARGYNHAYIGRKLFISENTVRTHVRHIYAKLGVNSREGLLDFIDGVKDRESAEDASFEDGE